MLSWFRDHRLDEFKRFSNEVAELELLRSIDYGHSPILGPLNFALLSDCEETIQTVLSRYGAIPEMGFFENPRHLRRQEALAARGDWVRLLEMSAAILKAVPPTGYQSVRRCQEFFIALCEGDLENMNDALIDLLRPKMVKERGAQLALSDGLICVETVTKYKLAWRHGLEMNSNSPLVPMAWMPIAPLPVYRASYPFLSEVQR